MSLYVESTRDTEMLELMLKSIDAHVNDPSMTKFFR